MSPGATFDPPTHYWELLERHEISVRCPPGDLTGGHEERLLSECLDALLAWQEAEGGGFEVTYSEFARRGGDGEEPTVGLTFELPIGRAVGEADWTWSARWRDWWTRLHHVAVQVDGHPPLRAVRRFR